MSKNRIFVSVFVFSFALTAMGLFTPAVAQVGPPGGTIYAHDMMYKTVATPNDLPNHGKFNTLYILGDGLAPVSSSAPGERDYRGGRWEVRMVTFTSGSPMQYTNAADVEAAAGRGDVEIGEVVKRFTCPLIKN
jgi:hypothetical protein